MVKVWDAKRNSMPPTLERGPRSGLNYPKPVKKKTGTNRFTKKRSVYIPCSKMGKMGIWLHQRSPPSKQLRSMYQPRRDKNQCRVQEKELRFRNPTEPQDDAREKKKDLDDSMSDSSSSSSSQEEEEEDSRKGHEEESKEHKSEVELEYGPCSEDAPCRLCREPPEDTPCRVCLRMGCNILVCPLYWGKVPPWVTKVGEDYQIACRLCNCIDDRCGHYGMRHVRLKRRSFRKTASSPDA